MGATPALMNARARRKWSALTMQWSTPVLLIALVYLIVQRSSRREPRVLVMPPARYAGSRKRWRCA
jgi:cytochrome c-type biogenesis protein CcmH/NrfF